MEPYFDVILRLSVLDIGCLSNKWKRVITISNLSSRKKARSKCGPTISFSLPQDMMSYTSKKLGKVRCKLNSSKSHLLPQGFKVCKGISLAREASPFRIWDKKRRPSWIEVTTFSLFLCLNPRASGWRLNGVGVNAPTIIQNDILYCRPSSVIRIRKRKKKNGT